MIERLEKWRKAIWSKKFENSEDKTEHIECDFGETIHGVKRKRKVMKWSSVKIEEVERFKYLESILKKFGGYEKDMK